MNFKMDERDGGPEEAFPVVRETRQWKRREDTHDG